MVVVLLPLNLGYQLIYSNYIRIDPLMPTKKYLQFSLEYKMSVAERMKGELLRHTILYGLTSWCIGDRVHQLVLLLFM